MSKVKVVDAMMGRGKTSAAAAYMLSCRGEKRFMYITPFLDEVDRICLNCDFIQPDGGEMTKSTELKILLSSGKNIASTHALFYLLDCEAIDIIKKKKYCLIIDESIDPIQKIHITKDDMDIMLKTVVSVDDKTGKLSWKDSGYNAGVYITYKQMIESGNVYKKDTALLSVMNPDVIKAFEEVIMMTYMFDGQYQKGYLDYFGIEYQSCGVRVDDSDEDNIKFTFTDVPDDPPPINFKELITIIDDRRINNIGNDRCALSKSWYESRTRNSKDMKELRSNMNYFFRRKCNAKTKDILWTTFKDGYEKLIPENGRFSGGFISLTSRATNKYKDRNVVAYMANRFVDPNVMKFFAKEGVKIDADKYALSEMLQFVWRSAIRDGKPITVYIPSKRMRELFINWIEEISKGDFVKND